MKTRLSRKLDFEKKGENGVKVSAPKIVRKSQATGVQSQNFDVFPKENKFFFNFPL